MKYIITESGLEKIINRYFNDIFEDSTLGSEDINYGGGKWFGVFDKNGELLIGHPSHDDSMYFYDGSYFFSAREIFDISLEELRRYLKNYVEDRFNIKINDLK